MSNSDETKDINGATAPIIPIDFTPHREESQGFSYKFKWLHVVVASFLLVSLSTGWFVLTARSVFVDVDPITAQMSIDTGTSFKLGQRYLMRTGSYQLTLKNEGYHDTVTRLLVNREQSQTHSFVMRKLPGIISFDSTNILEARIRIDGVDIGQTPLVNVEVEPGVHQLSISKDRYLDFGDTIDIEGRAVEQSFSASLEPAWATVSLTTTPSGADVLVDGEFIGSTPINAEIIQGQRDLVLKLAGHKAWQEEFDVLAGEDFSVPLVELEPADG